MPIDLRFRASQDYATRNGFVGAVPTFYVANLPSNIVYGALLIRSQAADWRDVPASALGGRLPADFATWVMAINAYAKRWGYACGFPTFLQTIANNDYAYGAMLFKKGTVQVQEPSADQLANQVIPVVPWFEAVQRFAAGQNQPGGYPTFETVTQRIVGPRGGVSGTIQTFPTVILPNSAAEWRDLPASVLNNPGLANPAQHVASMQQYAASQQGFVGAIPTFFQAELGGFRCGTLLLKSGGAEWQDVDVAELNNVDPSDEPGRFRAVQDYAGRDNFIGGYPNFYIGQKNIWGLRGRETVTINGTVLVNSAVAEWRDVAASDLGNPAEDDLPARFRATQDYAVAKAEATGGFPNFYQAQRSIDPGGAPETVYGTILLRGPEVEFRDIFYQELFTDDYIKGAIRACWESLGGPASFLGLPLTEELTCLDGMGKFNRFDGGVIYFSPAHGAFEVHGAILDRWEQLGFETSYLGYPESNESDWTDKISGHLGRTSRFENGSIVWIDGKIVEMPDTIPKSQVITTPDGTALGGSVVLNLQSNGAFTVNFHMFDSGTIGYDFSVRALFAAFDPQNTGPAQGGLHLLAAHSGHVNGSIGSGPTTDDHTDAGFNPEIQKHWPIIRNGTLYVSKDYSATGVLGLFEDLVGSIFSVAENAVGITVGIVLALGNEAGQLLGKLGEGAAFGLIGGVIVFGFTGGLGLAIAVVAGIVAGAVVEAQMQSRPITDTEYGFAAQVFGGALPPKEMLILTNFSTLDNRPFTMPGIDGKIYVNMADSYSDDTTQATRGKTYPTKGEVLIHELTHAWQIWHSPSLPWSPVVCQGIVNGINYALGQDPYQYGPPGMPWGEMNDEAQGALVDQWFGGVATINAPFRQVGKGMDPNDPYFSYIKDNIRQGQT